MPPIWTASNFDPLSIVPFATESSVGRVVSVDQDIREREIGDGEYNEDGNETAKNK